MIPLARSLGVAMAFAWVLTGCSSTASFGAKDREAIQASSAAWDAAMSARDTSKLGALYARDAVLLPENAPAVRGRAAIEDYLGDFPDFRGLEVVRLEIEGAGDLAYVWGSYSLEIVVGADSTAPVRGKFLEIWRRQEDGTWRIARDMFNSDLPPEPAN